MRPISCAATHAECVAGPPGFGRRSRCCMPAASIVARPAGAGGRGTSSAADTFCVVIECVATQVVELIAHRGRRRRRHRGPWSRPPICHRRPACCARDHGGLEGAPGVRSQRPEGDSSPRSVARDGTCGCSPLSAGVRCPGCVTCIRLPSGRPASTHDASNYARTARLTRYPATEHSKSCSFRRFDSCLMSGASGHTGRFNVTAGRPPVYRSCRPHLLTAGVFGQVAPGPDSEATQPPRQGVNEPRPQRPVDTKELAFSAVGDRLNRRVFTEGQTTVAGALRHGASWAAASA